MGHHSEPTALDRSNALVGTFRRFGPTGPVYEVLAVAIDAVDRPRSTLIRVVESGEEVAYPLHALLGDPEAL